MKVRIRKTVSYEGEDIYIPEYETRKGSWVNLIEEYSRLIDNIILKEICRTKEEAQQYIDKVKKAFYMEPFGEIVYIDEVDI